jgi:hypothetical protein
VKHIKATFTSTFFINEVFKWRTFYRFL